MIKQLNHYIYKTVNIITQEYYIGCRSCTCKIEDDYMYLGSGKVLNHKINKYGQENFNKEILCICGSYEDKFTKEAEIVTEKLLQDPLCLNLRKGGNGGWSFINSRLVRHNKGISLSEVHKQKLSDAAKGKIFSDEHKQRIRSAVKGKSKSEEHKQKMSQYSKNRTIEHNENLKNSLREAARNRDQSGENNPMYGRIPWNKGKKLSEEHKKKMTAAGKSNKNKICINNGSVNKFIDKNSIVEDGWTRGSILKNHVGSKNKKWINNGCINKYINRDDNLPNGWSYGMIKK